MDEGMMWQDGDPKKPLAQKLEEAIAYYFRKYGLRATTAMVPVGAVPEETDLAGVRVIPARFILPGNLWIGVERVAGAMRDLSEQLVKEAEEAYGDHADG